MLYDKAIQDSVKSGNMGLGVAQQLMKIKDEVAREQYTSYAVEHPITEKIAAIWVREANAGATFSTAAKTAEEINERPTGASTAMVDCRICFAKLSPRDAKFFFACADCLSGIDQANIDRGGA